jgi:hypothetical protein
MLEGLIMNNYGKWGSYHSSSYRLHVHTGTRGMLIKRKRYRQLQVSVIWIGLSHIPV